MAFSIAREDDSSQRAEAQSLRDDFFAVFGIDRHRLARSEKHAKPFRVGARNCKREQLMKAMHDLIELVGGCFTDVHKFDQDTLVQLKKPGLKVQKLVEFTDKLTIITGGRKT